MVLLDVLANSWGRGCSRALTAAVVSAASAAMVPVAAPALAAPDIPPTLAAPAVLPLLLTPETPPGQLASALLALISSSATSALLVLISSSATSALLVLISSSATSALLALISSSAISREAHCRSAFVHLSVTLKQDGIPVLTMRFEASARSLALRWLEENQHQ